MANGRSSFFNVIHVSANEICWNSCCTAGPAEGGLSKPLKISRDGGGSRFARPKSVSLTTDNFGTNATSFGKIESFVTVHLQNLWRTHSQNLWRTPRCFKLLHRCRHLIPTTVSIFLCWLSWTVSYLHTILFRTPPSHFMSESDTNHPHNAPSDIWSTVRNC